MYGKLINGVLMQAPNPLQIDGMVYYNPTAEMYEGNGYMEVVDTQYPEVEDMFYTFLYEEQDGKIVKVWTEAEPPRVETPEQSAVADTSAQDDTDAMLIDHEYRLTLLELGVSE